MKTLAEAVKQITPNTLPILDHARVTVDSAAREKSPSFIISLRTTKGWTTHKNNNKLYCDLCNSKLWQAPHGGIYCDTLAIQHERKEVK